MPGRSPESAARSARVASEIQTEMKRQGLTGRELAARIEEIRGAALPNEMWVSRRITGKTNLVRAERVVYGPTDDLRIIAQALNVNPSRLIRAVNVNKKLNKPAA